MFSRYNTIDKLRGVCFIFMFIFHIFSLYDYSTLFHSNMCSNYILVFIGLVRNIFIILAGISLVLSYKSSINKKKSFIKARINRSIEIMTHAIIISIFTHILTPDIGIKFGILHFIALSTLITAPLVHNENLTIFCFFASIFLKFPAINNIFDTITGAKIHYGAVDWFPLNKNLPFLIFGILLGHTLFKNNIEDETSNFDINVNSNNIEIQKVQEKESILSWIGKQSLPLYTLHFILITSVYFYLNSLYYGKSLY